MAKKKIYVLDTNIFLSDFNCIFNFGKNDIVIPIKVLEEIDKHKKRPDTVGANARRSIKTLDEIRLRGNFLNGIRIKTGLGLVKLREAYPDHLPVDFSHNDADNLILSTALSLKKEYSNTRIIVVSKDINMRIRCNALNLETEDYNPEHVKKKTEDIFTGIKKVLVDDYKIDAFYADESIVLEENIFPNEFVILISNENDKKTALAKFVNKYEPLQKIYEWNGNSNKWIINPKNKEQKFALDLLMNPDIKIVSLMGRAGTGKTLISIAAGLEQMSFKENDKKPYRKMIVSRPIQPMGKDIGYLPGSLEEKMKPWIAPIEDNLEFLFSREGKEVLELYYKKGIIEVEALTYIRGRSIQDAFIIIDEAQNLSIHEIKTVLTRVGNNSKIVLTGDIEQIDNISVDALNNGLTYSVEKLKHSNLTGHVTLEKGERSEIATLCAKLL